MKRIFLAVVSVFLSLSSLNASANPIPDFYQEPGSGGKRADAGSGLDSVDPFTGMLSWSYTDLTIPGAGGMDITINRIYQSLVKLPGVVGGVYPEHRNVTGIGWDLHFGRVRSSLNAI